MRQLRIFQILLSSRFRPSLPIIGKEQSRRGDRLPFFFICILTIPILLCGCSRFQTKSTFEEANDFFNQGNHQAALNKYEQVIGKYPKVGDRALFEMGVIYAHPKNEQKDYQKSLECFQKLIMDYPWSLYRQNSERMIFYLDNVASKDKMITTAQAQVETLLQEIKNKENEISTQQKMIETLEMKVFNYAIQNGPVDRILIEKNERRLMLISKGEAIKTYKIALGGNPKGPKQRQGDNKTPEGIYFIDSRNKDSGYHLALHISYPNETDKQQAREMGVSPGGNIMLHGIKNGFSWVGDSHTEVDWTEGCIAVTDKEIEEISKVAPNGTIVEIRP